MKIKIAKCYAAISLAAIALAYAVQTGNVLAETEESTESTNELAEQAAAHVTVIHSDSDETATDTETDTEVSVMDTNTDEQETAKSSKNWWKAGLTEYGDMLSLVTYENVDGTTSIGSAKFIAEGRNDSITASMSAESAVYDIEAGQFAFTSYGWGHCVGMSQNGANFYAKYAGWNYQDILFHYYPGTTLVNTGTAESELVTVQEIPGNVLQQVSEIVNKEVGPSFHVETIKAQAVAIYTYMKYHGNDAHDLEGKPNPPQSLVDACASVLGEALIYDGNFALTMFGASSGGITANCYDVFSADLPYLRSVISEYDAQYDPYWGEVTYFSIEEMRNLLQTAYGITLSSDPTSWITLIEGNGGYINSVIIDGQVTVRGYAFSNMLGLRAPKYTYICSLPLEEETSYFDDLPDVEYPNEDYGNDSYDDSDYDSVSDDVYGESEDVME